MMTKVNIPCVWGGQIAGILLKNSTNGGLTRKIIGVHGWLDNLNSLLPVTQKLLERHSSRSFHSIGNGSMIIMFLDYEIFLYDRAGHGFSGHLPKGCDYSYASNLQDLRTITQSKSSLISSLPTNHFRSWME